MLEKLTCDDFTPHLNQPFQIDLGETQTVQADLVEVSPLGANPDQQQTDLGRRSFSLLFRGPMEPALSQGIHHLRNDQMGELDLFLVPIGPDKSGMCYEAIFT